MGERVVRNDEIRVVFKSGDSRGIRYFSLKWRNFVCWQFANKGTEFIVTFSKLLLNYLISALKCSIIIQIDYHY